MRMLVIASAPVDNRECYVAAEIGVGQKEADFQTDRFLRLTVCDSVGGIAYECSCRAGGGLIQLRR